MTQVSNEKGGAGELCYLSVENLQQMTNDNCLFDLSKYESHKYLMAFI